MDPMDWTAEVFLVDEAAVSEVHRVPDVRIPRRIHVGREFLRFALASGHANSVARLAYAMKWMPRTLEA